MVKAKMFQHEKSEQQRYDDGYSWLDIYFDVFPESRNPIDLIQYGINLNGSMHDTKRSIVSLCLLIKEVLS